MASLSLLGLLVSALDAGSRDLERGSTMLQANATTTRPPMDTNLPARLETATFALGWFWGPDSQFGSLRGVYRTRVGYAGGTKKDPTYHDLGDHSETIEVDFDPTQITYEQLLAIFWASHMPDSPSWSRQYRSAVFYHDEAQRQMAEQVKAREEARSGRRIYTDIEPATKFTLAEDYHQKYRLRREPTLMRELNAMLPDLIDFVNSTSAARLNGYLAGYGTPEGLRADLDKFGLSPQARRQLLRAVGLRPDEADSIPPWTTKSRVAVQKDS
jgi:peptide-methionine (S)-S-oxide reductase